MASATSSEHAPPLATASSITKAPTLSADAATSAPPETLPSISPGPLTSPSSQDLLKPQRPKLPPHPRLSPRLYQQLRDLYVAKCEDYFELVSCGPDAPDKASYGDVDLLLCKVKQTNTLVSSADSPEANADEGRELTAAEQLSQCETLQAMGKPLAELLEAEHWHFRDGVVFFSFSCPDEWLGRLRLNGTGERKPVLVLCEVDETDRIGATPAAGYVGAPMTIADHETAPQGHLPNYRLTVDVVYTPHVSAFAGERLFNAYGDLSNIIYTGILSAGLTLKPSGLFVRVPQIQYDPDAFDTGNGKASNRHEAREASMIFLSNDVHEIFRFLGMDPTRYDTGFASMDHLFDWIGTIKYFYREDFYASHSRARDLALLPAGTLPAAPFPREPETSEPLIKGFNKRMIDRPMYQRFITTYLAAHPTFGATPSTLADRNRIMHAALDYFSARTRYHAALSSYHHRKREKAFWARVIDAMPTFVTPGQDSGGNVFPLSTNRKNLVALALKRCTVFRSVEGRGPTPHIVGRVEDMRNLEGAEMWTRFASLEPGTRPASSGDGEGGGARLSGFEAIAGPGPNESELLEWIKGHWAECYEFDRASTREERHRKVKVREDAKKVAGLSSMPC